MKVLVVGKGGREHALCWKLNQSPKVQMVYCAPGNAGTARERNTVNVPIEQNDLRGLLQFARKEGIDLTVVGPEEPLTLGIVDLFQREGFRIFGPRKDAAELEGSKVFSKELMRQAGIPTADYRIYGAAPDAERYILTREVMLTLRARGPSLIRGSQVCRTALECFEAIERMLDPREMIEPGVQVEIEERGQRRTFATAAEAREFVLSRPIGLVVKADGLAAGKGVYVCETLREALDAIDRVMMRRVFGKAGDRVIIEERLDGVETTVLAFTDGRTIAPMELSQDYKRAYDNDEGPNTGGMGAYSPAENLLTPEQLEMVERDVLVPVVHAMKRGRRPFRGVLYAGLMLTQQGPKVLEFNVRFGDPECQCLLPRLKTDLVDLMMAVCDERLEEIPLEWDPSPTVCVVMAAEGYPGPFDRGRPIHGMDDAEKTPGVRIFHAGTAQRIDPTTGREGRLVIDGGRVLNVVGIGPNFAEARDRAYQAARAIRFQGAQYRKDIALRALAPPPPPIPETPPSASPEAPSPAPSDDEPAGPA